MRGPLPTVLLLAVLLPAVSRPLASQMSYEGQPVSSVNLVTAPSIDVKPLQSLVQQKAGQPYSDEKVQASIDALKATHRFREVALQVEPEPAGLRILLILEPAYYYGVLEFPGSRFFPYARLIQVANLPDQEPFEEDQIERARTALTNFFHQNGFFQAEVTPSTELYEKEGLANVIFQIRLGKRAKIGNVQIQGPPPEQSRRLLDTTRSLRALATGASLKSGKTYTQRRIQTAQGLIHRYLSSQHFLAHKIRMAPPQYHPETNRADLIFTVEPGPKVDVRITGARLSWIPFLSSRREKKIIPLYEEGTFDQDLVDEGTRNLISYFQGKGFFAVQVRTAVQQQPDKISLVYDVDKGRRHKVDEIAFTGNQHISGDELLTHVAVQRRHFFSKGKFSDKLLRQSANNLEAVYRDNGFEQVSVQPQAVNRGQKVYVRFQITEGPQTRVESVRFEGNQKFGVGAFSPPRGFLEHPGAPFSPHRASEDRGHILSVYLDHGYLSADVKSNVSRHSDDPHKVDITYLINEGQQVRIQNVAILGPKDTRTSLISKTANLWTENPLSQGDLLQAESELYNLQIFDWASVGPRRPITHQQFEQAVVKVHESRRNSITYGFGMEVSRRGGNVPTGTVAVPGLPTVGLGGAKLPSTEGTFVSPRGSIEFTRRNLRGLAETGSVTLLISRLDQRTIATYSDPHFRDSQWSTLFSLSAERTTENPLFAARLGEVSYQFERALNKKKTMTAQFRYRFARTSLNDLLVPALVEPEDRSVRLSTFSATFIRDTRDKPLDAHRGFYQTADFGITGRKIGASADFTKFLGQTAYYKEIGGGIVWANSVRVGLAAAFSGDRLPTSERFFSGGGTSLRGFPVNGAGPQRIVPFCTNPDDSSTCVNVNVPVGGNQLFIFNSELRFPLRVINNLGGVVFYDGGNVYQAVNLRRFIDDYTNTVGFGIRYNTPVGPVRFDIGRNLNPITGFRATQFVVSLGQAF